MSDQTETTETIEQREMDQAAARLRHSVAQARTFELVQRVIAGVERAILCLAPETYDTAPAITVARSLNLAITEKDSARVAEAEDHFANELLLWRLSLCSRDEAIKPYDLRRFCERTEESLDATVFTALTRFYRSLTHTELSQSKYDFAVTQLYTGVDENDRRTLRFEGGPLVEDITRTFATWEQEPDRARASADDIQAARDVFGRFVVAAHEISEFEQLIASGLFNEVRHFKANLGEKLFQPEVTAAAIECNVAIANKFSELLAVEGAQIREAPAAYRNLTNILSDTSAIGFVSGALNDLQMAELDQQAQSSEHLAQLMRLLRVSSDHHEAESQTDGDEKEGNQSPSFAQNYSVPAELSLTLVALAEDEENKEIISEFLRTPLSEERKSLDPATFLVRLAEVQPGDSEEAIEACEQERQARRGALALILRSERMLFSKLTIDNPITAETETELSQLLEEMQQTDSILRRLISEARTNSQLPLVDQLLHISNHLLGARLSLQSALVERGAEELARRQQLAQDLANLLPGTKRVPFNWRNLGKYAAAAVVLFAFAGLTLRALTLRNTEADQRDKEVQVLDVKEMPLARVLVGARLRRQLLVVIVSSGWTKLTDAEKREELKALLQYGEPMSVDTVMVVDSKGVPRGNASDTHVTLDSDPPGR